MSTEARRASTPSTPGIPARDDLSPGDSVRGDLSRGDREADQPPRPDRDALRPQNGTPREPSPPRGETPQDVRTAGQDMRTAAQDEGAAARDTRTNITPATAPGTAPGATQGTGDPDTSCLPAFRSPATGHPPPPPKASARFPDTPPPAVGEDTRAPTPADPTAPSRPPGPAGLPASTEHGAAPKGRTAVPPRPSVSAEGQGRFAVPPPPSATAEGTAGQPAVPPRPQSRPPAPAQRPLPPAEGTRGRTAVPQRPTIRPSASAQRPGAPLTPAEGTGRTAVPPHPISRPSAPPHRPSAPPRPTGRPSVPGRPLAVPETPTETTARLRPVPPGPVSRPATAPEDRAPHPASSGAPPTGRPGTVRPGQDHAPSRVSSPAPSLAWSAPAAPPGGATGGRPVVSFGPPEGYDELARPRPLGAPRRSRTAAAAVSLVLGFGLIGGAVTGSWLVGGPGEGSAREAYEAAGGLWHNAPVDRLFPPIVDGRGAGPGGADRTWTRIAVAPDSGCRGAFDPLLRKVLDPVGCRRLLRATYTDATRSHLTTVGMLFTDVDAAAMTTLADRFRKDGLDRRTDLMPLPYAAQDTSAARFGAEQRASWEISVLTDAPVVVFAVSGWADGRGVDKPLPAQEAMRTGTTEAAAQAGLGHEARGLADRVERSLRKTVGRATEQPS